jgi:hypothetical protein
MTLCGKAALLLINGCRIKGNIPRIIQHSSIHHFKPNAKNLPLFTCGRFFEKRKPLVRPGVQLSFSVESLI